MVTPLESSDNTPKGYTRVKFELTSFEIINIKTNTLHLIDTQEQIELFKQHAHEDSRQHNRKQKREHQNEQPNKT